MKRPGSSRSPRNRTSPSTSRPTPAASSSARKGAEELIAWRKEFETGIADVDHEHRQLVDLINALHDRLGDNADHATVGAFLGEVFARISAHFALEESIMRKHRYDEYAAHKAEHEHLLDDIRDIMDDFEAEKFKDYRRALSDAVRDWFVNHFKTKDARLHRMLGV